MYKRCRIQGILQSRLAPDNIEGAVVMLLYKCGFIGI
jgi:hypothetical protein